MIAAHVTTLGYLIAILPVALPILVPFGYWLAQGCPHVDD